MCVNKTTRWYTEKYEDCMRAMYACLEEAAISCDPHLRIQCCLWYPRADPETPLGGGGPDDVCLVTRGQYVRTSSEKQLDPRGPMGTHWVQLLLEGGPYQNF